MSRAALLVQRAAYALLLGWIDLAGFLSFSTAVLAASKQAIALQEEVNLIHLLTDAGYEPTPVGVVMPDTTHRDEQALMTVLEKMSFALDQVERKTVKISSPSTTDDDVKLGKIKLPKERDSSIPPKGIIRHTSLIGTLPPEETVEVQEEVKAGIELGEPDRLTSLVEAIEQEAKQDASTRAMESQSITKYQLVPGPDACDRCLADAGKLYWSSHRVSHHVHCKCLALPTIIEKKPNNKEAA